MSGGANPKPLEKGKVGLCLTCQHVRLIRSDRGGVFYQCLRSSSDSAFAAYPRLPVLQCRGFEPAAAQSVPPREAGD